MGFLDYESLKNIFIKHQTISPIPNEFTFTLTKKPQYDSFEHHSNFFMNSKFKARFTSKVFHNLHNLSCTSSSLSFPLEFLKNALILQSIQLIISKIHMMDDKIFHNILQYSN